MKTIDKINSEDILTIDIETVRLYEHLKDAPEQMQSSWERKNTHEGVIPDFIELSTMWDEKSPLYAEFSKVCAISMSYLNGDGILKVKTYYGTNEKEILENFYTDLILFYSHNKSYRLMGHAAKWFDIPYLCKRYIVNGLEIPNALDESNCKPWEMKNLDTNELWKSFGTGPGSSLEALCGALNVPTSKVDLVGDEVGKAFYNGELKRIAEYCSKDVVSTFNVFRRFKYESIFQFEECEYIFQSGTVEKEPINVLDHILSAGSLNTKTIEAIVKYTKENKLNAQNVLTLVIAALSNTKDKVLEEDYQELKEALSLTVPTDLIECVVEKKSIGKLQVKELLKIYSDATKKVKKQVVKQVEDYIEGQGKSSQVRVKNSIVALKEGLL